MNQDQPNPKGDEAESEILCLSHAAMGEQLVEDYLALI
jgi:hypothetical protein